MPYTRRRTCRTRNRQVNTNVWTRLMDGTRPPTNFLIYYKCIFTFIILCIYLALGGAFLWMIENKFPDKTAEDIKLQNSSEDIKLQNSSDSKQNKKNSEHYIPTNRERSKSWTTFDSMFMCFAVASGSGSYPEQTIDTRHAEIFLVGYTLIGCSVVSLVTTYMTDILTLWAHSAMIFLSNIVDIFLDFTFNNSMPENPLRTRASIEGIYQRSLPWPLAVVFFFFYVFTGSRILMFGTDVKYYDFFLTSFNSFATLEVGKIFNVPSRAVIYLLYILGGISSFSICVESLRSKFESFLFR